MRMTLDSRSLIHFDESVDIALKNAMESSLTLNTLNQLPP